MFSLNNRGTVITIALNIFEAKTAVVNRWKELRGKVVNLFKSSTVEAK